MKPRLTLEEFMRIKIQIEGLLLEPEVRSLFEQLLAHVESHLLAQKASGHFVSEYLERLAESNRVANALQAQVDDLNKQLPTGAIE